MILTDDEIRKAAEFAAEQMWPESGYVGWTEDDAVFHRKFIEACFEKLRGGVELPEPFPTFGITDAINGMNRRIGGLAAFAPLRMRFPWSSGCPSAPTSQVRRRRLSASRSMTAAISVARRLLRL